MLSSEEYEALLEEVKREFPEFKIVKKTESSLMKAIAAFLRLITFGKMNSFMDKFITTLGQTVYVPSSWDANSPATNAITIRHERVHMRQSRDHGSVKFSLLYLFAYLPIGLAYYRTKFEKEAYEESLRAVHDYYGSKFFTKALKENVVNHFVSAEYLWMWYNRKHIEEWYDVTVEQITKK